MLTRSLSHFLSRVCALSLACVLFVTLLLALSVSHTLSCVLSLAEDNGEAAGEEGGTDECLEMMWPPDGYEVKGDELEDFVAMIRINCPGVCVLVGGGRGGATSMYRKHRNDGR